MKKKHSLKRKIKYLLLLLLISFNFNFAFGHIGKINQELERLNRTVQAQNVALMKSELRFKQLSNQMAMSNVIAKEVKKVVVEREVVESKVSLTEPAMIVTATGVVVKFVHDLPKLIKGFAH